MWGWFSAFREYGAPTFYGDQRTPVTIDTLITSLAVCFLIPSLAFLLILPGVKQLKVPSALAFFVSSFVGATLAVSLYHPCWHRGEMDITTSYRAFHKEKLDAHILVRVGLSYMNITLTSLENSTSRMHYNERFSFTEIREMEQELGKALKKGLPYPILKVIEYLSAEGFTWGRQYRVAGYYTKCLMLMAVISWFATVLCLCLVPPAYPKSLFWTGVLIAIGDGIFFWQLPRSMSIYFSNSHDSPAPLKFRFSICFQATCLAAALCLIVGGILWWAEAHHFYHFETIFAARRNTEDSVVDRSSSSKTKPLISCVVASRRDSSL